MLRASLWSWLAAGVFASSASAAPQTPVDLSAVFSPPTAAEADAVQADWQGRNPVALDWRVEGATQMTTGHTLQIVSHVVEGQRHYGALRYPLAFQPGGSHPVLVYLHHGFTGVHLSVLRNFDSLIPGSTLEDEYFYLVPSFRGESVRTGSLGVFLSEGEGSAMDRDVDDTIALLNGLLANVQEADRLRVCALGTSRGGGTALLLGIRDSRVRVLVDAFGMTDFFQPSIQAGLEAFLNNGVPPKNPAYRHALGVAVAPLPRRFDPAFRSPACTPAILFDLLRGRPADDPDSPWAPRSGDRHRTLRPTQRCPETSGPIRSEGVLPLPLRKAQPELVDWGRGTHRIALRSAAVRARILLRHEPRTRWVRVR